MKLLFTGFAPFGDLESNPSWDCLKMLPSRPGWFTVCLPVSFRRGPGATPGRRPRRINTILLS